LGGNNWRSPYELPLWLRGHSYFQLLSEELPQLLDDVPLTPMQTMRVLHDWPPAHSSRDVIRYTDSHWRASLTPNDVARGAECHWSGWDHNTQHAWRLSGNQEFLVQQALVMIDCNGGPFQHLL
jgi:hypothetical protein